jgi:hypothetical protein
MMGFVMTVFALSTTRPECRILSGTGLRVFLLEQELKPPVASNLTLPG